MVTMKATESTVEFYDGAWIVIKERFAVNHVNMITLSVFLRSYWFNKFTFLMEKKSWKCYITFSPELVKAE